MKSIKSKDKCIGLLDDELIQAPFGCIIIESFDYEKLPKDTIDILKRYFSPKRIEDLLRRLSDDSIFCVQEKISNWTYEFYLKDKWLKLLDEKYKS